MQNLENFLNFFNTLSREKERFIPEDPKRVTLYTCGPTVYDFAHIGNFRTYLFEDVLKRTLQYFGYGVFHVMNITDIDDKTIRGAIKKKVSLSDFTSIYKKAFFEDIESLKILPADVYPEATLYIPQMIEMIKDLLAKEIAYVGVDGSVYFSIHKFSDYGKLSHLKLDELKQGASERVAADEYEKETASDFVLWKHYDKERDGEFYWESPFGRGRPGWHIECSAMAISLMGPTVDIHCGGVDNIFPHHENEIAQSECCTQRSFVRYWLHAEHLLVDKKKMSKSLGNFYTLRDLKEKGFTGNEIRYLLIQTHYRTQLNFTLDGMEAAKASLKRMADFLDRLKEKARGDSAQNVLTYLKKAEEEFSAALADDLNISQALAVVFNSIRDMNVLIDEEKLGDKQAEEIFAFFEKIDSIFGIVPFPEKKSSIPQELLETLEKREQARREKRWKDADQLRDLIFENGYIIEDTKEGAHLKRR